MVKREKRKIASELIDRLLAGQITNDAFDAAFLRDNVDPALEAIHERLWFHWSNRRTQLLTGEHALNGDTALFERCHAFLNSNLEYEWPRKLNAALLSVIVLRALRYERWSGAASMKPMDASGP